MTQDAGSLGNTSFSDFLDDYFAECDEHLTGVPIADTAAMLEAIASERGLGAGLHGPLLPA